MPMLHTSDAGSNGAALNPGVCARRAHKQRPGAGRKRSHVKKHRRCPRADTTRAACLTKTYDATATGTLAKCFVVETLAVRVCVVWVLQ